MKTASFRRQILPTEKDLTLRIADLRFDPKESDRFLPAISLKIGEFSLYVEEKLSHPSHDLHKHKKRAGLLTWRKNLVYLCVGQPSVGHNVVKVKEAERAEQSVLFDFKRSYGAPPTCTLIGPITPIDCKNL